MTQKTALVTGAAGFIGRHMTQHLIEHGYLVAGVDPAFTVEEDRQNANVWSMDMREYLFNIDGAAAGYDLVVHAAAVEPHRKAIDTRHPNFAENAHLDASLFRWAHAARPGRVVYLSSSAAYPAHLQWNLGPHKQTRLTEDISVSMDADGPYGQTKVFGERLAAALHRDGVPVTIVRPFSGYGSDQSEDFPFGALVERLRRGDDPVQVWGTGEQVRDWIHVDDICRAVLALVDADVADPVNLGTGIGTSMRELIMLGAQIQGRKVKIEPLSTEPAGVHYRVAHPERMLKYYTPRWTLAAGIEERLNAY